ncbi:MAG TPA: long-chain fatty acid--CoA ligase, partial [Thermoplasmata archaeon]|nr:long-chain fatty acid--CoA ligase [Thermoplasmata archaeon]
LDALVGERLAGWPDRPALLFYRARWSYRRFWDEAGAFAAALRADGVGPGDRVALYLPNCPLYPIAFFGALRAGAVVVQVSPLYRAEDLGRLLRDADVRAAVTLEILYPFLEPVARSLGIPRVFVARLRDFYPALLRPFVNSALRRKGHPTAMPVGPTVTPWREVVHARAGSVPAPGPDTGDALAVLQYTGGTTGVPKAAMLSHRNLVANALQCDAWFSPASTGREVVLASVPFFHVYGMTVALTYPLLTGSTIVLQTRPDMAEALRLIHRYRPTQFPGVPAMYQAINQHPRVGRYNVRSIRVCVSGSAPLPVEVARRFESLTGGHLIEGYGLTEASPVTHANPVTGERRIGSIGLPFPGTDQRLVDPETGAPIVEPGRPGELVVRGPQVMSGYFRRPDETALVLADGWLKTGDIATIDADGYAFILDRKKDLINVGGFKVYPREVEEVLLEHPAVADAAVVGRADAAVGEVPIAYVVRRPATSVSGDELIAFVRERIAHYKAPRSVEFRDALPRSVIQKVLRRALRDGGAGAAPTDGRTAPAR